MFSRASGRFYCLWRQSGADVLICRHSRLNLRHVHGAIGSKLPYEDASVPGFSRTPPDTTTNVQGCLQKIFGKEKAAKSMRLNGFLYVVPGAGIEPARLAAGDFESREELRIGAGLRAMCSGFLSRLLYSYSEQNRNTFTPLA